MLWWCLLPEEEAVVAPLPLLGTISPLELIFQCRPLYHPADTRAKGSVWRANHRPQVVGKDDKASREVGSPCSSSPS